MRSSRNSLRVVASDETITSAVVVRPERLAKLAGANPLGKIAGVGVHGSGYEDVKPHNDEDRVILTSFLAERGVIGDPASYRAQEVGRAVLRPPVVAQWDALSHVGAQGAEAVDDGVVDQLEGGEAVADLGHVDHALAV